MLKQPAELSFDELLTGLCEGPVNRRQLLSLEGWPPLTTTEVILSGERNPDVAGPRTALHEPMYAALSEGC